MARDLIPRLTLIAALMNPTSPDYDADLKSLQTAAHAISQEILVVNAATANELAGAFETLKKQRAGALLIMTDVLFNSRRRELVALAARHAVPTVYFHREAVEDGGLISYGASIPDLYRQIGAYAGRILRGEKPADLPVLQPTKVELIINLRTARSLGLEIPSILLARADEVIE